MITNAKIVGTEVDPNHYHAQNAERGTPGFIMTSSALREFSRCPARWFGGYQPPDTDAKDYGALLDCLVLTHHQLDKRYVCEPATYRNDKGEVKPWHNAATVCRQWRDAQAGKTIVKSSDLDECGFAAKKLLSDDVIFAYVQCSDKQVWIQAQWQDKATGLTIPIQCLLDLVPRLDSEFAKTAGDLKTTRNAGLSAWQRWVYSAGYHLQGALFLDMLAAAEGGSDRNTWCWIVQENYAPYQTAKRIMSQDFTDLGRADYKAALQNYAACLKADKWPDYDCHDEAVQGWSVCAPSPWMADNAMFAPRLNVGDTESYEPDLEDVNV